MADTGCMDNKKLVASGSGRPGTRVAGWRGQSPTIHTRPDHEQLPALHQSNHDHSHQTAHRHRAQLHELEVPRVLLPAVQRDHFGRYRHDVCSAGADGQNGFSEEAVTGPRSASSIALATLSRSRSRRHSVVSTAGSVSSVASTRDTKLSISWGRTLATSGGLGRLGGGLCHHCLVQVQQRRGHAERRPARTVFAVDNG